MDFSSDFLCLKKVLKLSGICIADSQIHLQNTAKTQKNSGQTRFHQTNLFFCRFWQIQTDLLLFSRWIYCQKPCLSDQSKSVCKFLKMWIITMDSDGFCGFPWIVVVYSGWQPKNIGSFPMCTFGDTGRGDSVQTSVQPASTDWELLQFLDSIR